MPRLFHLIIETRDFLNCRREREAITVAGDQTEMREAIENWVALHDEIEEWKIARIVEERELPADSQDALNYARSGPHSYLS
jgi:hypothetical protein